MDRLSILREFISKEQIGVEIGPYYNPITPKREGYRALSLDLLDADALRREAEQDVNIPREAIANIEDVDIVGSACDLEALIALRGLTGQLDFIVSSHNFEHLPDPIRFLRACEQVLKPGGIVAMAIPDRRCCFDYFRGQSRTCDLLEAFFERRDRPTPAQVFDNMSLPARWRSDGQDLHAFSLDHDPDSIVVLDSLAAAFKQWDCSESSVSGGVHCWTFTPASFEWILAELRFLNLTNLAVNDVRGPNGCEFYVRLTNRPSDGAAVSPEQFNSSRLALLRRVQNEAAAAVGTNRELAQWKAERQSLEARLARLEEETRSLYASTSWRLTAPVRALARLLRGRA